ncbi:hypothetical protein O9992_17365 [Vibrio lentus]|nr:hypothetical protein [Vibrio lentus]
MISSACYRRCRHFCCMTSRATPALIIGGVVMLFGEPVEFTYENVAQSNGEELAIAKP